MKFRTYNPIIGSLGGLYKGLGATAELEKALNEDAGKEHALDFSPSYDIKPPTTKELAELAKPVPGEPESALPAPVKKPTTPTTAAKTTTAAKKVVLPPVATKTDWGTIFMWGAILLGGGYVIYKVSQK